MYFLIGWQTGDDKRNGKVIVTTQNMNVAAYNARRCMSEDSFFEYAILGIENYDDNMPLAIFTLEESFEEGWHREPLNADTMPLISIAIEQIKTLGISANDLKNK